MACARGLSTAARAREAWSGAARMAAWRAHAYCGAGDDAAAALQLEAARRPVRRAARDLLVKVHTSSINPIDLAMIHGYGATVLNTLRRLEGGEGVEFPLTPGRDFVGTVAGAAPGAALRPGARVWGVVPPHRPGAHAQYVVVDEDWVSLAPERLDDLSAGGALYGALSACAALRAAGAGTPGAGTPGAGTPGAGTPGAGTPGAGTPRVRRALVLGLGGVGHAAVQLLVRDCKHVVVSCAEEQAATAARLGAEPLDRRAADHAERLRQAGPFDVVIDCAGLGGAGAASLPCAFGVYVTLSSPLLRRADTLGLAAGAAAAGAELLRHNLAAPSGGCAPRVRWAFFSPRRQDIEMLRRRADRGEFTVDVEQAWGWREAAAAYARAARGHARGKLLLDFREP